MKEIRVDVDQGRVVDVYGDDGETVRVVIRDYDSQDAEFEEHAVEV